MNLYQQKYLKYKTKYELLKQIGGNKRLLKELDELKENPLPGIIVEPVEDNIFLLHGTITGPPNSPYKGYMWKIRMIIPQMYPFESPIFNFVDRIFHPNISYDDGNLHMSISREYPLQLRPTDQAILWNPAITIRTILLSIQSLLMNPSTDSPFNQDAANLYINNREEYNIKVRKDAETFATLVPPI